MLTDVVCVWLCVFSVQLSVVPLWDVDVEDVYDEDGEVMVVVEVAS
jgi:hypothetical protein